MKKKIKQIKNMTPDEAWQLEVETLLDIDFILEKNPNLIPFQAELEHKLSNLTEAEKMAVLEYEANKIYEKLKNAYKNSKR